MSEFIFMTTEDWRSPSLALVSPVISWYGDQSSELVPRLSCAPVCLMAATDLRSGSASHCVAHNYHLDKENINWLSRNPQHPGPGPDANIILGPLIAHSHYVLVVDPIMPSSISMTDTTQYIISILSSSAICMMVLLLLKRFPHFDFIFHHVEFIYCTACMYVCVSAFPWAGQLTFSSTSSSSKVVTIWIFDMIWYAMETLSKCIKVFMF